MFHQKREALLHCIASLSYSFLCHVLCEDSRFHKVLAVRMVSVEEEKTAMAVEGPVVHGDPFGSKDMPYLFIAVTAAEEGGGEENRLSCF